MKNFLIEDNEKNRILKMHSIVKEQSTIEQPKPTSETSTMTDVDKLNYALNNCIKEYIWFTPDPQPIRKTKSGKSVIFGKGKSGASFYFYPDLTFVNQTSGSKYNWACDFKPLPVTPAPEKSITLDDDQKDVLARLRRDNWFTSPKPTKVALDNKEFEASDLTKKESATTLGKDYSQYFPTENFPNGFFVYRKAKENLELPKNTVKTEISRESCRAAIEKLYDHKTSPLTNPLEPDQHKAYAKIFRICAEPANRNKFGFLGIGGIDKKFKSIKGDYGVE